ncbi:hypothetical protein LSUE1_G007226 [Lachnellula suecica]|uniref:DDE-1 domain-containing protein n=1 Tax=Lachnellula suecica TaxID=602035 RepID=A0A8T9C331_9HELO|nr:hypothetical protein LSUE1_G007226 [Lachnellula suecica]
MDETGVMLCMLGSVKVLVNKNNLRDYKGTGVKRTMITTIECISANDRSLLPMIIWPATTHRSNWTTFPTPGWHYACSKTSYTDSKINLEWLTRVFDPQTKGQTNQKPRVLICDDFGTHETLEVLEFCFANNIILCRLPSHTSHKLQPCDVKVFAPLKAAYRDKIKRLYQGGVNTIGKEHFTLLDKAFSKRNITSAWAATGLFPLSPDRVLRHTPKPPDQLSVPEPDNIRRDSILPDEVPQTPTTPVSAKAFISLHNLIKQDILDEKSVPRVQRRVQKLANAGQKAIAYCALLENQKQSLIKINNEAKVRRSTRAIVLGNANVISFEDLEVTRATRATKDAMKGKGKRGRKRKRAALDEGESHPSPEPEPEPEPEPKVARAAERARERTAKRNQRQHEHQGQSQC